MQSLQPYFGTTVQFPLGRALNVKKGYLIGADRAELGAGARARDGQRHVVAREPRARRAARSRARSRRSSTCRPRAVPLPVPDRAPDLQRDADHVAEAAEAEGGRAGARRRLSSAATTCGSNCVPDWARSSATASAGDIASR